MSNRLAWVRFEKDVSHDPRMETRQPRRNLEPRRKRNSRLRRMIWSMPSRRGTKTRRWIHVMEWLAWNPAYYFLVTVCLIAIGWSGWQIAKDVGSIHFWMKGSFDEDACTLGRYDRFEYEEFRVEEETDRKVSEECVGLISTRYCTPWGPIRWKGPCTLKRDTLGGRIAGYCLCGNGRTTAHHWCGQQVTTQTCSEACKVDANRSQEQDVFLPLALNCAASKAKGDCTQGFSVRYAQEKERHSSTTRMLWKKFHDAYASSGILLSPLRPPGPRNGLSLKQDFVRQGIHLTPSQIHQGKQQWRNFLASAPSFAQVKRYQRGRGIVTVSSVNGQYLLATLVQLMVLQRLGCRLPIEVWLPETESPTAHHESLFYQLGARMRLLLNEPSLPQSGFALKITAIALSSFREVLFLDSDNIPVYDPSYLFQSKPFQETGAVVWPDLWDNSVAPDLCDLLEMDESQVPRGTHESGQLLLDKGRVWPAVMLALFMNLQGDLYFPLLTEHMGQGDKETLTYSLAALGLDHHKIGYPVQPLGITAYSCNDPQLPRLCSPNNFFMNAMLQHDMHGRALFVHNNHAPKASLFLPASFEKYVRRWQRVRFKDLPFLEAIQWTGVDIERVVYEIQRKMACDSCILALFQEPLPGVPLKKRKGLDHTFFYFGEQLPLMGGFGSHLPLVARNISYTEVFGSNGL